VRRYSVKVGNRWVTSPTSETTERAPFRAVFESLTEAHYVAADHGGTVMVEPSDWRGVPTVLVPEVSS
jgi:hypothetical protein